MSTVTATASSTWAALPNLRAFSPSESLRLLLIVGSLATIALAGQFAQSRAGDLTEKRVVTTVATQTRPAHKLTPTERYARKQIQTFSELLDGLTERAESVLATVVVADESSLQMKSSLRQLDEDLMYARQAYANFEKKTDRFNEEDLRSALMNVQDSATLAQSQLITLDSGVDDQGFKVSRIGQ